MAEGAAEMTTILPSEAPLKADKIIKVLPEDYSLDRKEYTPLKIICLGDSAVGKSKLIERFLAGQYNEVQQSTYALNLYRYETKVKSRRIIVDFWDTAGQEQFNTMHHSYYHQAHACVLVFDVTRKVTYKNLPRWYKEMRHYRPNIPCILVANKIDVDYRVTERSFKFARDNHLPFYFVSASDGTNVVRIFKEAIKAALLYKENSTDFLDLVMKELEEMDDLSSTHPVVPLATPLASNEGTPLEIPLPVRAHEGTPIAQNSH